MNAVEVARKILEAAERHNRLDLNTCLKGAARAEPDSLDRMANNLEEGVGRHFDTLLPPCSLSPALDWQCREQVFMEVVGLVKQESAKGPSLIRTW